MSLFLISVFINWLLIVACFRQWPSPTAVLVDGRSKVEAKMDGGDVNDTSSNHTQLLSYNYTERPETYIVPVLFSFIFFVGTIGNGSLVLIFFRHKHMINVPNIYILSLALGDLLVLLSCIPFTSTVYTVIIIIIITINGYRCLLKSSPLLWYILFYFVKICTFIRYYLAQQRSNEYIMFCKTHANSLQHQKKKVQDRNSR